MGYTSDSTCKDHSSITMYFRSEEKWPWSRVLNWKQVNTDRFLTINRFMLLDKLVQGKVSECLKVTLHQISLVIYIPWNVNMCPCSVSQQLTDLYCRQNKNQRTVSVYCRCIRVLIYWETEYFSHVNHHDLMD